MQMTLRGQAKAHACHQRRIDLGFNLVVGFFRIRSLVKLKQEESPGTLAEFVM